MKRTRSDDEGEDGEEEDVDTNKKPNKRVAPPPPPPQGTFQLNVSLLTLFSIKIKCPLYQKLTGWNLGR